MSKAKAKDAIEDYRSIDVRTLHKAGALTVGRIFSWKWKRWGEVVASIGSQADSRCGLRLRYQLTRQGKSEEKDYLVPITWTPCHLGGERPWFLCPCCGRRVARLYSSTLFACRHCLRLNYRSQQTSKRDRPCDRSWDLRSALGCDEGFLSLPAELIRKPKGMHWRTFERKLARLKRVDACAMEEAFAFFDRIERRSLSCSGG